MQRRIIAGNWKMNPVRYKDSLSLAVEVDNLLGKFDALDRVIFPPFVYISDIVKSVKNVEVGAQNVFFKERGAFTGEISPLMLVDMGVKWVIIGHSERRHILREDEDVILKKVKRSLEEGLTVILCVGETLQQRELFRHREVVKRQLDGIPDNDNLIITYEPVWAIGTGRNANPEQIEEMHTLIKDVTGKMVLYGGSVKPENAPSLASVKNVDGFLVGGASLKAKSFYDIAESLVITAVE